MATEHKVQIKVRLPKWKVRLLSLAIWNASFAIHLVSKAAEVLNVNVDIKTDWTVEHPAE